MHSAPETKAIHERTAALRQRPDDPQAILELAQSLEALGREHLPEADRLCADLIARFSDSPQARRAEEARTRIAQSSIRCVDHGGLRMEVVQYIADALAWFEELGPRRREEIALEIALLGQHGLDIVDPAPKYSLQAIPGSFCGLRLLAIMYAAFRQIDPAIDIGADFLREYELARASVT
jgi:hypothetical protein